MFRRKPKEPKPQWWIIGHKVAPGVFEEYTPEKHEAFLLNMNATDFSRGTFPNYPTVKRFRKQEDGSVYSFYGRYYFSKELWERRVREFRYPDANHDFLPTLAPVEVDVVGGQSWPRRGMLCTRCGEHRDKVSLFVDTARLNKDGWCVR